MRISYAEFVEVSQELWDQFPRFCFVQALDKTLSDLPCLFVQILIQATDYRRIGVASLRL